MKKKLLLFLCVLLGILSVSGCGTSGQGKESAKESAVESKEYKVAMLVNSSISDGGWGANCYQAMVDAANEYGWESAVTDNVAMSDYVSVIQDYASQGFQLIFAPGNEYQSAVEQVASEYKDTYFCLLNGTLETDNVTSVLPDAKQIGYMAGALAGLMTETNNVGFIGGMELDTTKEKLESYTKAAEQVNSNVSVQSAYAGSFSDAAKGKEIASSMLSLYDVDVIFGDASAVDTGAREVFAEKEKRYGIGQPGDLGSAQDKVIINSVVTDNAALVSQCIKDIIDATYGNKTIKGDLSNGCLKPGTFSDVVSQDIQEEYLGIVEQIKNGTFISE
jgi:basic membrane protein A and related proteins